MNSLFSLAPATWPTDIVKTPEYQAGNAAGWLARSEKRAATNYPLSGRLYLAKSGWLLLSVPNALVRGVFDAMTAPGAELPLAGTMNVPNVDGEVLNAHISVMTAEEVEKIGPGKINERGHHYGYTLGPIREIDVKNVDGVSKVWAIQVMSPGLAELRKSYGLSPLPKDQPFHITVAVRRKNVLGQNAVSKFDTANGRGELKAAAEELPWRERVEIYTKHPKTGKIFGGVWDNDKSFAVPGGGIDPGETPEQAAVRELAEEAGIQAANPVRVPVGPIDNSWSDAYRASTGRNFAGSRTHFVVADFINKARKKNLDVWHAKQQKFYSPESALALMRDKQFMSPDVAKARMKVLQHIIDNASKKTAADVLPGGEADNTPDREFSKTQLQEGAEHEHEHTRNDQVAKEIAKDHLSEDPRYYEKQKALEKESQPQILKDLLEAKAHSDNKRYDHKAAILRRLMTQAPQDWIIDDPKPKYKGVTHTPTKFKFHAPPTIIPVAVKAAANSVYLDQLKNMTVSREPITYDHNKPVFENIRDQMFKLKQRGDWMLRARRNEQIYRASLDPKYRHQLALQAFHGTMPQPAYVDQLIERYGDNFLGRPGK